MIGNAVTTETISVVGIQRTTVASCAAPGGVHRPDRRSGVRVIDVKGQEGQLKVYIRVGTMVNEGFIAAMTVMSKAPESNCFICLLIEWLDRQGGTVCVRECNGWFSLGM